MKRSFVQSLIFASVVTIIFVSCNNDESSEKVVGVTGSIKNTMAFKVILEEPSVAGGSSTIIDSATLGKEGAFTLKAPRSDDKIYTLRLKNDLFPLVTFINDGSAVKINADYNNKAELYSVEGSESSKKIKDIVINYTKKWNNLYSIRREYDSLTKAKANDSVISRVNQEGTEAFSDLKNGIYNYLRESKTPAFSWYVMHNFQNIFTVEEYMDVLDSAMKKFPASNILLQEKNILDQKIANAREKQTNESLVGKEAPNFSLPDVNGKEVALSSFRGKYVLVDFWASWCGPCRAENPNVVSAYNKYKGKNFTILGVSLDRPDGKKNWLKAIKDDKLTWTHVSDLKFWNSEVVPLYRIEGIPFNVLVDPQGMVIAEKLRGTDLDAKLNEVLK